MKNRFNTYDLVCSVTELQKLVGMRVNQIYDVDSKTYLIRLQRSEEKCILLLESGNRVHTTVFEWPKNVAPSGFSMKMRKHLKNKRLENLMQMGVDRIIDFQFGSNQAAYHIIIELYDRGNIILTDYEMVILNILRPHTEGEKIRLAVNQKYPIFKAHTKMVPTLSEVHDIIKKAKQGESLKKILNPHVELGAAIIDHVLAQNSFPLGCKLNEEFDIEKDVDKLHSTLMKAEDMFKYARENVSKGYIIQKREIKPLHNDGEEFIYTNIEFHPFLYEQCKMQPYKEYESFDKAVDEYFSTMESQKLDLKVLQQERDAYKKLENVRKDHNKRLTSLGKVQEIDKQKAELITRNQVLVDNAIRAIHSALATQMSWEDINIFVKEAQAKRDDVACAIVGLKLNTNHITLFLSDPYEDSDNGELELKSMTIDIDLAYSAFANATKYYNQKRSAAQKQQKTIESEGKALKSAEKKTKQALKEVQTIHTINKARKIYWFEKFYWFITSENYLVIGGRDQQQNELVVKKYLRSGDIYVHADLSGASSVIIKNPDGNPIPPKSLAEAGTMAVAYSIAWEAKIVIGAYWVYSDQVSKTAPTGEYLTTGSFMIRGKKNYLPPSQLIMGLGCLFRLEDSSIERHKHERRVRAIDEGEDLDHIVESHDEIELEHDIDDDKESIENLQTINEEIMEDLDKVCLDNCDNDQDENKFLVCDTHIKLDLSGPKVKFCVNDSKSIEKIKTDDDQPISLKNVQNKDVTTNLEHNFNSEENLSKDIYAQTKQCQPSLKRGQRGKLKKIKEKYKDQDEEDKKLLMAIIQSAGPARENKRKNKDPSGPKQGKTKLPQKIRTPQDIKVTDYLDDEDITSLYKVDMLEQLTGKPMQEDELLFSVPVIAPYSTLQNYKFKVKLTPGTAKRGKAAKTGIDIFLKDKSITSREKDLLKSVKDESIARNLPGKVKISAPQIQKLRK